MSAQNDITIMTTWYIRLLYEFICQPIIPHPYRAYQGIHHIDIKEKEVRDTIPGTVVETTNPSHVKDNEAKPQEGNKIKGIRNMKEKNQKDLPCPTDLRNNTLLL